jgi:hypothetical protein
MSGNQLDSVDLAPNEFRLNNKKEALKIPEREIIS